MTIRRATNTDASSIAVLCAEVWSGTYLRHGISAFFADYVLETFTAANTRALIHDPAQFTLVSQNAEGIDGVMRLSSDSAGPVEGCSMWEIATLYVQPRHHGKGIGQRLLKGAITRAGAQGAASVWLTTNAENTPAIAFYDAQGFTQIGETHFMISDQKYLNNVYRHVIEVS
jgi:diamine N-acetyltransferase